MATDLHHVTVSMFSVGNTQLILYTVLVLYLLN
jgi:hypothetical protein